MKLVFECQLTKLENQLLIELIDSLEMVFVLNNLNSDVFTNVDLINKRLIDINAGVKVFKSENKYYIFVYEINEFIKYLTLLFEQNGKQGYIPKFKQIQRDLIINYVDFIRLLNTSLSI